MAYFADIETHPIAASLEFPSVSETSIQQFRCTNGEIAGFRIRKLATISGTIEVSQVLDCSSGIPILQGTVAVVPGIDLTGGYFSSGCFCDSDPMVAGAKFYRMDYV